MTVPSGESAAGDDWERIRALVAKSLDCEALRGEAIAPGLSAHRFVRVALSNGRSAVARIAPEAGASAGSGPEPPFEGVRAFLETAGLPVPACLARAPGIALLEDLGSQSLESFASRAPRDALIERYREACALVPRLQALASPSVGLPAFERHLSNLLDLKRERTLGVCLESWLGRAPGADEREAVERAFLRIADAVADAPARLAHRDFQSSNLMIADDGRLVMIDLQGALLAPPEYDLVCLLRDSYVALDWDEVVALRDEVRPALPDHPDPETFARRFDLLTIARKSKDLAFFLEAGRRGDARFARFRDTTERYLRGAAERLRPVDPCFEAWCAWLPSRDEGNPCAR